MKAKAAIRKALDQPWLYNEEELKRLQGALKQAEDMGVQELWHRRTTLGFSNEGSSSIIFFFDWLIVYNHSPSFGLLIY